MENTTTVKMTKKAYFEQILANYPLTDGEKEFVNHELELLASKANAVRKPSARQIENDGIKSAIVEAMAVGTKYTIGEMLKQFDFFTEDMTSQRVSALVSQLVDEGKLVRETDKRKAYFSLAE